MYNLMPLLFGGIMFFLGLYMAINPKSATKKELQNDADAVAKIKKNGFIVIACGVVILIIGIIRFI